MRSDRISRISIDEHGRVYVFPEFMEFPHVYREAMEVYWKADERALLAPGAIDRVRLASAEWWFCQILEAAKISGCSLDWDEKTIWQELPAKVIQKLKAGPQDE